MLTSTCRCGAGLEMRRTNGGDSLVWQCVEVGCSRIHGPVVDRDLIDVEPLMVPSAFNRVHQVPKASR